MLTIVDNKNLGYALGVSNYLTKPIDRKRLIEEHATSWRKSMARILLVEDDELSRDMLSRRLKRKDFEVVVAVDGQQGIDMASSEEPDLILMDLRLPVIDGWEATKAIKANEATKNIPIIAVSAHAATDDRGKALEAGCDEYDSKPVDFPRLLGKIQALLGESS